MSMEGPGNGNERNKGNVIPFPGERAEVSRLIQDADELGAGGAEIIEFPRRERLMEVALRLERASVRLIAALDMTIGEIYMEGKREGDEEFDIHTTLRTAFKEALDDMRTSREAAKVDDSPDTVNAFDASLRSLREEIEDALPRLGFEHD